MGSPGELRASGRGRGAPSSSRRLLLWFLLKDEEDVARWQSGFIAADGTRKPAFDSFREQSAALAAAEASPS